MKVICIPTFCRIRLPGVVHFALQVSKMLEPEEDGIARYWGGALKGIQPWVSFMRFLAADWKNKKA